LEEKLMTKSRVVGLLSAWPLFFTVVSAETIAVRGQVLSITPAECRSPTRCGGSVTLWNDGTRKTVRVRSDTQITRAGESIHFAELGVGNLVTLKDVGEVKDEPDARSLSPVWGAQAP
jgi:hypothetical protein